MRSYLPPSVVESVTRELTSARRVNDVLSFRYFALGLSNDCVDCVECLETIACSVFEMCFVSGGPSVDGCLLLGTRGGWLHTRTRAGRVARVDLLTVAR